MKKCPKCQNFSVAYNTYRGVSMCMLDGCSCVIINDSTYSYLMPDPAEGTVNRIKVIKDKRDEKTTIIKKYSLA